MSNVFAFDDFGSFDGGEIDLKFRAEQEDELIHFVAGVKFVVGLDFDQLDVKFWENDLADIEIKLVLKQDVKIAQIAGVVRINCYCLGHPLEILSHFGCHL